MKQPFKYNTFWKRWLASMVDGLLFSPLVIMATYQKSFHQDISLFLVFGLSYVVLYTAYVVFAHGRFGQTIGKYLLGIKLYDLDEQHVIGYKRAFIRESVWFFTELAGILLVIFLYQRPSLALSDSFVLYDGLIGTISTLWLLAEIITMAFNEKRRAVHDLMAGSVVIDLMEQKREVLHKKREELIKGLSR